MSKEEIKEYSEEVQKLYLEFMISNNNDYVRCRNILKPEYWDARLRPACRFILSYTDEYGVLPTPDQINAETQTQLNKHDQIEMSHHSDWFLSEIESFCRHKAMESLIMDGPDLLLKGKYAEVERRSRENMMISLQGDIGTDYFADPLKRLQTMRDRTGITSTGWKTIDYKLFHGMKRGELNFFAGGPGSGKSLFLQNLALNWVQMGLHVVYITLELSEDLVGGRFDSMITRKPTKEIFKNIEDIALAVSMEYKKNPWGSLQIKKMPEAGTTANTIRSYLKEYEIRFGRKPDGLLVDYLDLLHPNSNKVGPSDLFVKDKYTSEELRALAFEWNTLTASASQLNRSSITETEFDQSHIAGGISKINTADNVMAILSTKTMREHGRYQIQFLKTRSSSGVGSHVELAFDPETLRITDVPEGTETPVSNGGSALMAQLAAKKAQAQVEQEKPKEPTETEKLAPIPRPTPTSVIGQEVENMRDRMVRLGIGKR